MRFLVENAVSPVVATLLTRAGHDALHVRTIELQRAEDIVIFDRAAAEDRIIVTADTDFGACWPRAARRSHRSFSFAAPEAGNPLVAGLATGYWLRIASNMTHANTSSLARRLGDAFAEQTR